MNLEDFFQTALYSTRNLPLAECLATAGVALTWCALPRSHGGGLADAKTDSFPPAPDFGARFKQNGDGATLTHVFNGGSAENAALCPQDKIIALNGFACTDLALQWSQQPVGSQVHVHFFRTGVLHETVITVEEAGAETALLAVSDRQLLEQWLFDRP